MTKLTFFMVGFSLIFSAGCAATSQKEIKIVRNQVNKLSSKLRLQRKENQNLKEENLVLRQLAGAPTPAIKRVKNEGQKVLKIQSEEFLYKQIRRAFRQKNRIRLHRAANVLKQKYPKSQYGDNAIYLAAVLDLNEGRLAESLSLFDEVLIKYPKGSVRASAVFGKGISYKKLNLNEQAKQMFRKVVEEYPKTKAAQKAKVELKKIKNI